MPQSPEQQRQQFHHHHQQETANSPPDPTRPTAASKKKISSSQASKRENNETRQTTTAQAAKKVTELKSGSGAGCAAQDATKTCDPPSQKGPATPLGKSPGAPIGSAAPATAKKIDSDLLNVANENRVILNVGGIRHETYKVSVVDRLSQFACTGKRMSNCSLRIDTDNAQEDSRYQAVAPNRSVGQL